MTEILFENKNVIACVKPHGVLSQNEKNGVGDITMLSLVSEHIGSEADLVHRLDRPTGGIMIFSKNKKASGQLSQCLADKTKCIKEYLAVVSGAPKEEKGEFRDFLFKDAKKGKSFVVDSARKGAKEAVLSYEVLASAEGEHGRLSLIKIRLGTGRTHQIRVQFSSRGMPVVGDGKYGSRERMRGEPNDFGISPKDMIALYSYRLLISESGVAELDIRHLPSADYYPFSLFNEFLN